MEKIAIEIRHLQRTEVREAEEPFASGQKGSSAMPHKRNPVKCEQVSGLSRLLRGYALTALENVSLWHERDISHSSAERIIFPDTFTLTDFILAETTDIIKHWRVYPERMKKNFDLTRGLVFSQRLLLALTKKDLSRDDAYHLVQKNSLKAWEEDLDFMELVRSDPQIMKALSPEEIQDCFSLDAYLEHIDTIFERVLKDEN